MAALITAATACGGVDTSNLPPPATPSPDRAAAKPPVPEFSPAEQEAVEEAQARFDEFMHAYVDVSTAEIPTPENAEALFAEIEQYADGVLPQELRTEIVGRWGQDTFIRGTLAWEFIEVTDVDLEYVVGEHRFPTVFLDYCVDASDWVSVDDDTGEVSGDPGGEHVWSVDLSWSDDWGGLGVEGWRVVSRNVREREC